MKLFNIFFVLLLLLTACKQDKKQAAIHENESELWTYTTFGDSLNPAGALDHVTMNQKFEELGVIDTVNTKFKGTVTEVCQSKGCWMKLKLSEEEEVMVKFKDYGFFVPKDIAGKEVIVRGKAFKKEMSIEDQQHFAKDAGKTDEEIKKITKIKKAYGFEADGVLLVH